MSVILRVYSKAGRSRVEMGESDTVHEFKQQIQKKLNLTKAVGLFKDEACKVPHKLVDAKSIKASGFKNGDIVYVGNADVQMDLGPPKKYVPTQAEIMAKIAEDERLAKERKEKGIPEKEEKKSEDTQMIDTNGKKAEGFGTKAAAASIKGFGGRATDINSLGITEKNWQDVQKGCECKG